MKSGVFPAVHLGPAAAAAGALHSGLTEGVPRCHVVSPPRFGRDRAGVTCSQSTVHAWLSGVKSRFQIIRADAHLEAPVRGPPACRWQRDLGRPGRAWALGQHSPVVAGAPWAFEDPVTRQARRLSQRQNQDFIPLRLVLPGSCPTPGDHQLGLWLFWAESGTGVPASLRGV